MYFGNNGITATHAAFIKNVCKEFVQADREKLSTINVVDSVVSLIGSVSATTTSVGVKDLEFVVPAIDDVTRAFALSAWLGEAITAKEEMLKEVERIDIRQYCKIHNIEMPVYAEKEETIDDDDVIAAMSISERYNYLMLETRAAHIGEVIHPNKSLSNARKQVLSVEENPTKTSGSGRDMTITTRSISVDRKRLDELFFDLQNEHRKAQSALNQIKSDIKKKVDKHNLAVSRRYSNAMAVYTNEVNLLREKANEYVIEERKRISALKIVIPNELKEFYNLIDSMGK